MKKSLRIIFLFVSIMTLFSVFVLYKYYSIDTLIEKSILDFDIKQLCGSKPILMINNVIDDSVPIPSDTIVNLYEYDVTRIRNILLKKCKEIKIEIPQNTMDNIRFMRNTNVNKIDIYSIFITKKKLKIDCFIKEFLIKQSYINKKNDYLYEIKNIKKFVWKNFKWNLTENKIEKIKYYENGYIEIIE